MKKRILTAAIALLLIITLAPVTGQNATAARTASQVTRYTVLVLDTTGPYSISTGFYNSVTVGSPLENVKQAALKFVDEVLGAEGTNYVALVTCTSTARVEIGFTDDIRTISNAIRGIPEGNSGSSSGFSNFNEALVLADSLLQNVEQTHMIRNILFFSGCLPAAGESADDGRYSASEYSYYQEYYVLATGIKVYAHANVVYTTAQRLKNAGYNIYTLSCFTNLDQQPESFKFAKQVMYDIQNRGSYDAENPEDLIYEIGEAAKEIVKPDVKGFFRYASEGKMQTEEFLYYDDMFNHSAATYDHDLATMSLELAMAAFGVNRKKDNSGKDVPYATDEEQAANVISLLKNPTDADDPGKRGLGFEDVHAENYRPTPTADSIAAVFGHKTITCSDGDYELIAIAIRGGEYKAEWGGDFKIGSGDIHEGFEIAKDSLMEYFSSYLDSTGLRSETKVKLWITGYSRAAAVANLFAAELVNKTTSSPYKIGRLRMSGDTVAYTDVTSWEIKRQEIFAYCFATPNNSKKPVNGRPIKSSENSSEYPNIFNIVNPNDIVPRVAPESWGYSKYGKTQFIPATYYTKEGYTFKTLEKDMLAQFTGSSSVLSGLNANWYLINSFRYHKGNFGPDFRWPPGAIYDVGPYPNKDIPLNIFFDQALCPVLFDTVFENRDNYVKEYQDGLVKSLSEAGTFDLAAAASAFSGPIAGIVVNEWLWQAAFGGLVASTLVSIVPADSDPKIAIKQNSLDFLLKDVSQDASKKQVEANQKALMQGHYPELYLAWMRALPADYFGGVARRNPVYYRVIHIDCPVDLEVYDAQGKLLGKIEDDIPELNGDSGILLTYDGDGQKAVYLPAEEGYTIKITGTDTGTMTYSVAEYSRDAGGNVRLVNYYDVPVTAGAEFTSTLGAVSPAEEETVYELRGSQGRIAPDDDLKEAAIETFSVDVKVEGSGGAVGAGKFKTGSFTVMEAFPLEGADFLGWYKDAALITSELTYKLCVRSDASLTARFTQSTGTVAPTSPPREPWAPSLPSIPPGSSQGGGGNPVVVVPIILIAGGLIAAVIIYSQKKSKAAAGATPDFSGYQAGSDRYAYQPDGSDSYTGNGASRPDRNAYPDAYGGAGSYGYGSAGLPSGQAAQRGSVSILTGSAGGRVIILNENETLYLGKGSLSRVPFPDDYTHVSRMHCTVTYNPAANVYTVTDSSSNGTFLGDYMLPKGEAITVQPGSVLKLANENCTIRLG